MNATAEESANNPISNVVLGQPFGVFDWRDSHEGSDRMGYLS